MFIKIALGLGLDLDQTNDSLQRYGKYPKLYSKSMEDAILFFVINHPDYNRDPYEYYKQLKKDCLEQLKSDKRKSSQKYVTENYLDCYRINKILQGSNFRKNLIDILIL